MTPETPIPEEGLSAEDRELLAHVMATRAGAAPARPTRVPHSVGTPLSSSQRQLWVLEQLHPGDPAYYLSVAFHAAGPLDLPALVDALSDVVARHEILRTTFPVRDDEPWQQVHEPAPVSLAFDDRSDADDTTITAAVREEARAPFDLVRGPLFRARVMRIAHDRHVVMVTMHHLVSDGWSMGILYRELAVAYDARRQGRTVSLPPLEVQFRDVAVWQRRYLTGDTLAGLVDYWRQRLDGAVPLSLPADRARTAVADSAGAEATRRLDRREVDAVDVLAREERATRFMALMAAFVSLLARYGGTRDVVVGTPIAGRDRVEIAPLVGYFVNLLPLRVTLAPRTTFRDLMRQVRDATLGAYDHQDLPLDMIEGALQGDAAIRQPLFPVTFSAQEVLVQPPVLSGLRLTPVARSTERARFDLEAHVLDDPDGIRVSFVYRTACFEDSTVQRMVGHYLTLLGACVAQPDVPVMSHAVMTEDERRHVEAWNATERRPRGAVRVPSMIAAHAAAAPDRVAIGDGPRTLSYRELDAQSNRWAHWLRRQGVCDERRVGVLIDRSADLAIAVLAVLRAGGAYVPLDPTYPAARLAHMIDDARVALVLTTSRHASVLPAAGPPAVCLDTEVARVAGYPAVPPDVVIQPDQLAYVVYTSGSTGTPKGVAVPHAGLENLVHWHNRAFAVSARDRATLVASVGFDASVWELWPYLAAGASLHVVDDDLRRAPDRLWQWMQEARISVAFLPTPLAEAALREGVPAALPLRLLLTGGDRLGGGLRGPWPFALINNYGPTESTVVSTSGRVSEDGGLMPSIGGPIDNLQAYVVDEAMILQPVGVVGELYVGGASLARGYLGRAAQTAERFVPNPFSSVPGSRLYRTGDRVRWRADGSLDFVGRDDAQVKVRGFRIELGEVEAALGSLPGVRAAIADVRAAGHERRLVGYVVPEPGVTLVVETLRERLRAIVPPYMVPAALVPLAAVPLTANGKIDRRALPEPVYQRADGGNDEPSSPVEHALVRIWAEVLRLDRVGIHDNFFDLGGDSVLSIQIASRAARAGIRLSPRHFFEHQTIAELAAVSGRPTTAAAVQPPLAGAVPLTPTQRWFLEQDQPEPDHFCQSIVLEAPDVPGSLLRAALGAVAAQHDVLRTRFIRDGARWTQELCATAAPIGWNEEDLSLLTEPARMSAVDRVARRLQSGLRLGDGVLMGAACFRRGKGLAPQLLLVMHHLVVDAVSWRVIIEDLSTAVEALEHGRPVLLPEKTTSFQQWARLLSDPQVATAHDAERMFWDEQEREAVRPLPVVSMDPGVNTVGQSASVAVSLTDEETRALLRDVSRTTGARPNEVLLAAVAAALHRWVGGPAVRLDVEGHGRGEAINPDVDLSRTVGWFTVVYPIAVPFGSSGGIWTTIDAVRDRLRAVPRGGLGYGLFKEARTAGAVASPLRASGSDVSFNYLGQIDQAVPASGAFRLVAGSAGADVSLRHRRPYLIDVNARVADGRLGMTWTFCPVLQAPERIGQLAADAVSFVRTAITEAGSRGRAVPRADDVPLAGLDDAAVRRIAARFPGAAIDDLYPLTPLQRGMLVHGLARPGSGAFVTQIELALDGSLQTEPFREAWHRLQARHPVLRTAFTDTGGGTFQQVILRDPPLPWRLIDWSALSPSEAQDRLRRLLDEERVKGFGLDEAPSARLVLVALPQGGFDLVWTHHHALLDGWSVVMLLEELVHLYEARVEGRDLPEDERPAYRDYIAWRLTRPQEESQRFWRRFLQGFTTPTRLNVDAAPRLSPSDRGPIAERERWVDAAATRAIVEAASRHRLTLNTVVQGAWALLLSRYSGDRDVVFGTAVAGRPAELAGVERMVGLFLNGVPMRALVQADAPLASWLQDVQRSHVEVRQHEHEALSDIQSWSEVPPGEPLFETTVAFENYPVAATLDTATRRMGIVDFRLTAHTSAALHLRVVPGERLRLMLSHARLRFDDETATEMLAQVEAVLRQFAASPEMRVEQVSLETSPSSAAASPVDWSRGAVHQQIVEQARRSSRLPALSEASRTMTYAELDARSNAVAHAVVDAGVRRGDVVGVLAPRSAELVVCLLGVLRAGAAFTILDPAYPWSRRREQLEIAAVTTVLVTGNVAAGPLEAWAVDAPSRRVVRTDGVMEREPGPALCVPARPDDLAYVAFTSGSTGRPKAIRGRHASLAAYAWWMRDRFGMGEGDRVSLLSALSHDPLLRDIFPPLQLGAAVIVPGEQLFDRVGALPAWMRSAGVTVSNLTPAMAQLLLEGSEASPIDSLRLALFVGEPLTYALVDRWRALAPAATCVNLYGATESQQALGCFVVPRSADSGAREEGPGGTVPVGQGIPGVRLRVTSASRGPAGAGEVGEVWIQSEMLAGGYINDDTMTAERFVADAFGPGSGHAYRTGDRGRLRPNGDLIVLGRADDLVKIRGFRVEPGDVEAFLARQPDVREAAVAALRDANGDVSLAAFVAGAATPSDLRRRLRQHFPDYLVPSRITRTDRLPRTVTGKLDRRALGTVIGEDADRVETYVAPRTPIEAQLVDIWSSVLRVDRVGVLDSFFDLGGHSIVAARLVGRMRDVLGVEVRIADVFERPRIAELAPLVEAGAAEQEALVSQLADEIRGLSPEELQALLDEAQADADPASGTESGR